MRSHILWPAYRLILIFLGLALLYGLSTMVPYVSPFTRVPFYIVACDGMPIAATRFAGSNVYSLPGDDNYQIHMFTDYYFCDEESAQEAGFRRDTF